MDKRKDPRYKRRIQLRFWGVDDKSPRKGFTQNISVRGIFVSTASPFRPGNRVFLEIPTGQEKLVLQAEVRYSARVDPALQRVKPSGMGVRLLRVDEIMSEFLKLKAAGIEAPEAPEAADVLAVEEPSGLEGTIFPITYDSPHQLASSYERDIKYGGLFVAARDPAEQDEKVVLEFRFGWDRDRVVQIQAQVVKRFAAAEGSMAGESVSGMGVAFADPADTIAQFHSVLATLEQTGGQGGQNS